MAEKRFQLTVQKYYLFTNTYTDTYLLYQISQKAFTLESV